MKFSGGAGCKDVTLRKAVVPARFAAAAGYSSWPLFIGYVGSCHTPSALSLLLGGHDEVLHSTAPLLRRHRPARPLHAPVRPRPGRGGPLRPEPARAPRELTPRHRPLSGRPGRRRRVHVRLVLGRRP